jgi:hypothetical protein
MDNGQQNAFPAIYGSSTQLNGLVSIKSKPGCWNKKAEGTIRPGTRWPRWGSFTVVENGFGGNEKFKVSGERLEARLGGLVLDYPTELTADSIYSRQERWPVNLDWDTRRPEITGVTSAVDSWSIPWRPHRRRASATERFLVTHHDRVKHGGT